MRVTQCAGSVPNSHGEARSAAVPGACFDAYGAARDVAPAAGVSPDSLDAMVHMAGKLGRHADFLATPGCGTGAVEMFCALPKLDGDDLQQIYTIQATLRAGILTLEGAGPIAAACVAYLQEIQAEVAWLLDRVHAGARLGRRTPQSDTWPHVPPRRPSPLGPAPRAATPAAGHRHAATKATTMLNLPP